MKIPLKIKHQPVAPSEKDLLLQTTCKVIEQYFDNNQKNADSLVKILDSLSRNNIEAKHDYSWMYKEKDSLFQKIIQ